MARQPLARRPRLQRLTLLATAAWLAALPALAGTPSGVTAAFVCGTGDWSSAACWAGGKPPGPGDNVVLANANALLYFKASVYNDLNNLNLQGFSVILNQSGGDLFSQAEFLDSTASLLSTSLHVQQGGRNSTGWLSVGSSGNGVSSYSLSGTATLQVADSIELGTRYGIGASNGAVVQSDASSVSAQRLAISGTDLGHQGSYQLVGGTLTTGLTDVGVATLFGQPGSASFLQTGGVHTTDRLRTAITGTYTLQGGRLNLGAYEAAGGNLGGSFDWQAGMVHVDNTLDIGDGSMPFNEAGVLTLGAGRTLGANQLRIGQGTTLDHGGGQVWVGAADSFSNQGSHLIGTSRFTVDGQASSSGLTQLAGGTLDGANGTYINLGQFSGQGRIAGDVTVVNQGQWLVSGGRLQMGSTQAMRNEGTLSFAAPGDALHLMPVVGGTGLLDASFVNLGLLQLTGQQISGDGLLINAVNGSLTGWGTVRSSFENQGSLVVGAGNLVVTHSFNNLGVVDLASAQSRLDGLGLMNSGLVQGQGNVAVPVYNLAGGTVEARAGTLVLSSYMPSNGGVLAAGAGARLQLLGGLGGNASQIVLSGGTVAVRGLLSNTGSVSGWGQLEAAAISNAGRLQFSGGSSQVAAPSGLSNGSQGQVIVSGQANVSFLHAVRLDSGSELRISEGAVATFFGPVQVLGGALLTGTGHSFFEGGFSLAPGAGSLHNEGSIRFGAGNLYTVTLAGAAAGSQAADASLPASSAVTTLRVDGRLTLDGTLKLVELPGWQPVAGTQLMLFDAGTLDGQFSQIDTSDAPLASGLGWDFSQLAHTGTLSVTAVPEPATWALWLAAGALGWAHRRRRLIDPGGTAAGAWQARRAAGLRGALRRASRTVVLVLGLGAAVGAQAAFSAFATGPNDALGVSANVQFGGNHPVFDTLAWPAHAGDRIQVLTGLQDPVHSVGSGSAGASAGFGWLLSASGASASWVPPPGGGTGTVGGAFSASTGFAGSPAGARMTFFSDLVTVNAAGHTGEAAVAHASLRLTSHVFPSLPNISIGQAAQERAVGGVLAEVATGVPGSWGEGGLSQATSHRLLAGGLGVANGPGYNAVDQMTVTDGQHSFYDGVFQPVYTLQFDIPVTLGEAFSLNIRLETGAVADVGPPALPPDDPALPFARYAFAQTDARLEWQGISSVTLAPQPRLAETAPGADGMTLASFSVSSGSGADYAHAISAVPEPAVWALWLLGTTGLLWRRRAPR